MRTTRSYLVRLLIDPEQPQTLRGVIRSVIDDEEYAFIDEASFLKLLYRLSSSADQPAHPAAPAE